MKTIVLLLSVFLSTPLNAQSKISILGGWTASKVRAIDPSPQTGPYYDAFNKFSFLHVSFQGFEYEYSYRKLHLSTGFFLMALGQGC